MYEFEKAKPAKAAQVVAQQIRKAVLSGALNIGDKLPAERNLIEQLGYSRSVVREALRLLEDEGLIELQAGRNGGATICKPDASQIVANVDTLLRLRSTSIHDVHEAQRLIEPLIVELVIKRGTAEDFAAIRRTIELIEENPNDIELVLEQSNRFHVLLSEATKNNVVSIIGTLIRQIVIDMRYEGTEAEARAIAHIHRRILEAIEGGDREAAVRRSLRHIDASEDIMCARAPGAKPTT